MSHPIEVSQRVQILDPEGKVTGSFVPERLFQQLMSERDDLRAEIDRLREEVANLRKANASTELERDQYLKSLYFLLPKDFTFTEEEILDLQQNGVSLEETIEAIRRM